jgi:hypothetical protein
VGGPGICAIAQLNLAAQGLHDEIARFNGQF